MEQEKAREVEEEDLEWKYRKSTTKNELIENLKVMVEQVVAREVDDIVAKLDSMCNMGMIENPSVVQELRQTIQELKNRNSK